MATYEKLRKKYSLPDEEDLNRDFDLEDIDPETELLLAKIRVKMHEKIDVFAKLLESMLQPDSNLSNLYEAHHVNEDKRNKVYSLYKKLMSLKRKSELIAVSNKEKDNAEYIKETYDEWDNIKPSLEKHISQLVKLWKKETDMSDDLSYFG